MKIEQGTGCRLYTFNEYELAQYDLEIRKPLEDEIERLKNKLADLTEEYELTVEGFDREYAQQNVRLGKAFTERNNEKLNVIAELEDWVDGYDWGVQDDLIYVTTKDLRQIINEIKGGVE